jgi:hypothetical protein
MKDLSSVTVVGSGHVLTASIFFGSVDIPFSDTTWPKYSTSLAPATFERLMETVLAGLQWDICLIYLDDVIIYGKNFDEMIRNLSLVFDRLSSAGLKLKPRKCRLFAREVEYLGHVVSENGISTDPKKFEAVKTWPEPTTVTELRSFIGFCSYYRRFIEGFADIAKPLHKLTQKGKYFVWTDECQVSFD